MQVFTGLWEVALGTKSPCCKREGSTVLQAPCALPFTLLSTTKVLPDHIQPPTQIACS